MAKKKGISPEEFIARLKKVVPQLAALSTEAPVVKGQVILDQLVSRIFKDNKSTNGQPLPRYAEGPYKSRKAGRLLSGEAGVWDLQNTQELLFAMNWGQQGISLILGITNPNRADVSRYLEEKAGRPIFTPSDNEQDVAVDEMVSYVRDRSKEILDQTLK